MLASVFHPFDRAKLGNTEARRRTPTTFSLRIDHTNDAIERHPSLFLRPKVAVCPAHAIGVIMLAAGNARGRSHFAHWTRLPRPDRVAGRGGGNRGRTLGQSRSLPGRGDGRKFSTPRKPSAAAPQVFNGLLYYRMQVTPLLVVGLEATDYTPLHLGVECPLPPTSSQNPETGIFEGQNPGGFSAP